MEAIKEATAMSVQFQQNPQMITIDASDQQHEQIPFNRMTSQQERNEREKFRQMFNKVSEKIFMSESLN